jgi:DNA processing protein
MAEPSRVGGSYSAEAFGPRNPQETLYAPKQLFAAGYVAWLRQKPRVAVVGARKASPEGVKRAARLARILVKHGAIVVSGLATRVVGNVHDRVR